MALEIMLIVFALTGDCNLFILKYHIIRIYYISMIIIYYIISLCAIKKIHACKTRYFLVLAHFPLCRLSLRNYLRYCKVRLP